jgi:hypothetical protein
MNETGTLIHRIHSPWTFGDDLIVPTSRSTDQSSGFANPCPTRTSGSAEGSYLLRRGGGMDLSRTTEVRNLERFWVKAGFEAPSTRFRPSRQREKPSA